MNERIYNRKEMKERRQQLRRVMTPAERMLWQSLRGEQMGVKFRRQFSVGPFVLDFYCPQLKLALEIYGPSHEGAEDYDRVRQESIEALNIVFLRFSNREIYRNQADVLETIAAKIIGRGGRIWHKKLKLMPRGFATSCAAKSRDNSKTTSPTVR